VGAEYLVAIGLETGRVKDFARIVEFLEQEAVDADTVNEILNRHGLASKWGKFRRKYLEGL